jgi:hypothetical protein
MSFKATHWNSEYKCQIVKAQKIMSKYRGLTETELITYVNQEDMGIVGTDPLANAQKALVLFALSGIQQYLSHNPGMVYNALCDTKNVCIKRINRMFDIGSGGIKYLIKNIKKSSSESLGEQILELDLELQNRGLKKYFKLLTTGVDAIDEQGKNLLLFAGLDASDEERFIQTWFNRRKLNIAYLKQNAISKLSEYQRAEMIWFQAIENAGFFEKLLRNQNRNLNDEDKEYSVQHLLDVSEAFEEVEDVDVKRERLKNKFKLTSSDISELISEREHFENVFKELGACIENNEDVNEKQKHWFYLWTTNLFKSIDKTIKDNFDFIEDTLSNPWYFMVAVVLLMVFQSIFFKIEEIGPYKIEMKHDSEQNIIIELYQDGKLVKVFGDVCAICLEDVVPKNIKTNKICMTTACQHYFHCACIKKWFQTSGSRCPLCRKKTKLQRHILHST